MKFDETKPGLGMDEELEPELRAVLNDFRLSIEEWSQAEISRPRAAVTSRPVWRRALGWALGCALLAGGLSAGIWNHHRQVGIEQARVPLQQQPVVEKPLPEQTVQPAVQPEAQPEEEQLLARVDQDVARQVPSAMEPLAQLMANEEETR